MSPGADVDTPDTDLSEAMGGFRACLSWPGWGVRQADVKALIPVPSTIELPAGVRRRREATSLCCSLGVRRCVSLRHGCFRGYDITCTMH